MRSGGVRRRRAQWRCALAACEPAACDTGGNAARAETVACGAAERDGTIERGQWVLPALELIYVFR